MDVEELKEKALALPIEPGVYIMRDEGDHVIYVGKAKKLKNRVSQYFQDTGAHNVKTRIMVSKIHHFDVIAAASEFEALILECSLIKQYMPRYNILLKDDKGFPYLRLNMKEEYPQITLVNKAQNDGAIYFGPYGGRSVTHDVLETLYSVLKLPTCGKKFPKDIGKARPCLNYHMRQCEGWCRTECEHSYRDRIDQARLLLEGQYKKISTEIQSEMRHAAENMNFELAASLRDRYNAVEALGQKQLVTAGKIVDIDVIGVYATGLKICFTVLHFSGGNLLNKDFEIVSAQEEVDSSINSFVKQYYINRGYLPREILLPMSIEDQEILSEFLECKCGRKTRMHVPQRGDNLRLVELANKNAKEELMRVTTKEERIHAALDALGKMLAIAAPVRIESFDISNISGTDIVAGMVVFKNGKACNREYKHFRIRGLDDQDDYSSMHQAVYRRFKHYIDRDAGFCEPPNLVLIDGGANHAKTACDALQMLGLEFPVLGMVKDDRHRTRSLISANGLEIGIDTNPAVFSLIGEIQEETHRFAISYHRKLRSNRLKASVLDNIEGIGPKRKQLLLKKFKSISAIKSATLIQLEQYLPKDAAASVYNYFHRNIKE